MHKGICDLLQSEPASRASFGQDLHLGVCRSFIY
jgi:hypothetical protein